MADIMFALIAFLAFSAAIINGAYVIKHRCRQRSRIRAIQALTCGFIGVVMLLDASGITGMDDISGWLLLVGLALILSASMGEGIIDL
jgi:hypothetical protein